MRRLFFALCLLMLGAGEASGIRPNTDPFFDAWGGGQFLNKSSGDDLRKLYYNKKNVFQINSSYSDDDVKKLLGYTAATVGGFGQFINSVDFKDDANKKKLIKFIVLMHTDFSTKQLSSQFDAVSKEILRQFFQEKIDVQASAVTLADFFSLAEPDQNNLYPEINKEIYSVNLPNAKEYYELYRDLSFSLIDGLFSIVTSANNFRDPMQEALANLWDQRLRQKYPNLFIHIISNNINLNNDLIGENKVHFSADLRTNILNEFKKLYPSQDDGRINVLLFSALHFPTNYLELMEYFGSMMTVQNGQLFIPDPVLRGMKALAQVMIAVAKGDTWLSSAQINNSITRAVVDFFDHAFKLRPEMLQLGSTDIQKAALAFKYFEPTYGGMFDAIYSALATVNETKPDVANKYQYPLNKWLASKVSNFIDNKNSFTQNFIDYIKNFDNSIRMLPDTAVQFLKSATFPSTNLNVKTEFFTAYANIIANLTNSTKFVWLDKNLVSTEKSLTDLFLLFYVLYDKHLANLSKDITPEISKMIATTFAWSGFGDEAAGITVNPGAISGLNIDDITKFSDRAAEILNQIFVKLDAIMPLSAYKQTFYKGAKESFELLVRNSFDLVAEDPNKDFEKKIQSVLDQKIASVSPIAVPPPPLVINIAPQTDPVLQALQTLETELQGVQFRSKIDDAYAKTLQEKTDAGHQARLALMPYLGQIIKVGADGKVPVSEAAGLILLLAEYEPKIAPYTEVTDLLFATQTNLPEFQELAKSATNSSWSYHDFITKRYDVLKNKMDALLDVMIPTDDAILARLFAAAEIESNKARLQGAKDSFKAKISAKWDALVVLPAYANFMPYYNQMKTGIPPAPGAPVPGPVAPQAGPITLGPINTVTSVASYDDKQADLLVDAFKAKYPAVVQGARMKVDFDTSAVDSVDEAVQLLTHNYAYQNKLDTGLMPAILIARQVYDDWANYKFSWVTAAIPVGGSYPTVKEAVGRCVTKMAETKTVKGKDAAGNAVDVDFDIETLIFKEKQDLYGVGVTVKSASLAGAQLQKVYCGAVFGRAIE